MTATVRAIETRYAGYRFRSRLAANIPDPDAFLAASTTGLITEDYAVLAAYRAARSARFEHGESGGS